MRRTTISFRVRHLTRLKHIGIAAVLVSISASFSLTQMNGHQRGSSLYAALAAAPEAARARQNPFEGNTRDTAAGGKLFEQHCADCHGRKAGGTRRGPSLLTEEVQQAPPGALFWILTNGVVRHGMPVWSKLPEPERWQIVTFLESLRAHSTTPATTGESANR